MTNEERAKDVETLITRLEALKRLLDKWRAHQNDEPIEDETALLLKAKEQMESILKELNYI